jgi:hypothetical protein
MPLVTGQIQFTPAYFNAMFETAMINGPHLLPNDLTTTLTSAYIDAITYALWLIAVNSGDGRGDILTAVQKYVILFDEVKLRALARLDLLPTWWFFRERVLDKLVNGGWTVDDGVMNKVLRPAWKECLKAVERRNSVLGVQGGREV